MSFFAAVAATAFVDIQMCERGAREKRRKKKLFCYCSGELNDF